MEISGRRIFIINLLVGKYSSNFFAPSSFYSFFANYLMTLERLRSAIESLYASTRPPQATAEAVCAADVSPKPGMSENHILQRGHPVLHPVHVRSTTSMLSTAESHDVQGVNFRGMLNLFFIILFVLNIRLVVENIVRYGPIIQLPRMGLFDSPTIFMGYLLVLVLPYLSFIAERYIALSHRKWANLLQGILILGTLVVPYVIVMSSPQVHPLRSLVLLMASLVYAMKIGSYWHVCVDLYELRLSAIGSKLMETASSPILKETIEMAQAYPSCLTVRQMYMFIAYPTLVFQLVYPRTESIRKRVVFRYLIEFIFCLILQFILIEQYITPLLRNTIVGIEQRVAHKEGLCEIGFFLIERFLKLSIPNLYIWLLMFAELFHCYLNILAELTMFGDRKFYLDWWNAVSIRDYWQKWNLPVHNWLLRHMYKPFRKLGFSASVAGLSVFVISGVIHEYLIITPIGLRPNGVITLGFILQIPLITFTDSDFVKNRPTLGNCLFWITSCFTGQPLATLIHFLLANSPTVLTLLFRWVVYADNRSWEHVDEL